MASAPSLLSKLALSLLSRPAIVSLVSRFLLSRFSCLASPLSSPPSPLVSPLYLLFSLLSSLLSIASSHSSHISSLSSLSSLLPRLSSLLPRLFSLVSRPPRSAVALLRVGLMQRSAGATSTQRKCTRALAPGRGCAVGDYFAVMLVAVPLLSLSSVLA